MTLDEYVIIIRNKIKSSATPTQARTIINEAKRTLTDASLTVRDARWFWTTLYSQLNVVIKEVNHDQSHAAVSQAQSDIAQMLSSGELK